MKRSPAVDDLTKLVASEQDERLAERAADASATERAKDRLRSHSARRRAHGTYSLEKLAALVAIAAAIALLVGTLASRRNKPLAFTVNGAAAEQSGWVRVPADDVAVVHFTDASTITLEASSRARVVDSDANGARVVLESGVAHVAITHRETTRWHVIAGPFDVVVTGTQFDVTWDPATEHFSVRMTQGTVHVLGALLGAGHALSTGEQLDVSVHDGLVHEGAVDVSAHDESKDEHAATAVGDAGPGAVPAARVGDAPKANNVTPVDSAPAVPVIAGWVIAARNGDFPAAVSGAENAGFANACDHAKLSDVLALGDAARFTGHDDEARQAYSAVRARAPDDPAAAECAFDLGRLAFDRNHDYALAAKWFDTYGRERPNGPLAREAAGRLIEARQRAGDRIGLEAAAANYLAKYPDGPHADLARSIAQP